jgi:hypothetical protein
VACNASLKREITLRNSKLLRMQNSLALTFAFLAQVRYPAVLAGLREFYIRKRRIFKCNFNVSALRIASHCGEKFILGYMRKEQESSEAFGVLAQVR